MDLKLPQSPKTPLIARSTSSSSIPSVRLNGSLVLQSKPATSSSSGPLRIAYQGSPGAYSELAAKTAAPNATTLPFHTFSDAISSLHVDQSDIAVLPVESTLEGSSLRNYHLLLQHDLHVVGELSLFVHYALLAVPGVPRSRLRHVISHPLALAHCSRSLSHLNLRPHPVDDTAGALHILRSRQLLDTAAIASPRAAPLYGLHVIAHGIQDENWNVTRFLLLSKSPSPPPPPPEAVKTSAVIAHRGGSMTVVLRVLTAFSSRGVNLTKLEARNPGMEGEVGPVMVLDNMRGKGPTLRAFTHVLYVDFEGSVEQANVREAMEEIGRFSVFVRILGCYAADRNVYDLH